MPRAARLATPVGKCARWALALLALAATTAARAEDEGAPSGRGQGAGEAVFQWVPPPSTDERARYSIGVFDAGGKLVRRLAEAAPEASFSAGMNGFVTRWDLKGDGGKRVPNGRYVLRGVAIPPLKVSGVAASENDWVKDDPALVVTRVLAFAFTDDGGGVFFLRLKDGREEVARYAGEPAGSPDWKLRWRAAVPSRAAADSGESKEKKAPPPAVPRTLTATADFVLVKSGDERWVWRLADGSAAASDTPGLDDRPAQPTREAGLPEFADDFERAGFGNHLAWRRAADGSRESVRLISDKEPGESPLWSRAFTLPIEKPGAAVLPTLRVELARSGLDSKKRAAGAAINLRGVTDEKGAHLATAEGLRLRTVSATKALRSAALAKGEGRGQVRFVAQGDVGVEEFLVEGCDRLAPFQLGACTVGDAGEVTKPGEDDRPDKP